MHDQAYQRFMSSRQESVRLSIALEEFFSSDLEDSIRQNYEIYLKKRLGPAVSELVLREDLSALETLRSMGWLDSTRIDDAIVQARRNKRTASLVWLLQIKDIDYGYYDKVFPL